MRDVGKLRDVRPNAGRQPLHVVQPGDSPVAPTEPTPALTTLARAEASILSPLRYPGSKRRFAGYVRRTLELNDLKPRLFVEPFAGGASVSLQLLNDGVVEKIGLIDLDPLVAAFWRTVFFDTDWLVRRVERMAVTLRQWKAWHKARPRSIRDRALKCLFLNRTSFSGIIAPGAGPIGGWAQKSEYDVACRFPRETLVRRIEQAAKLSDRVAFVWSMSWSEGLAQMRQMQHQGKLPSEDFLYLDPPFFEKADRLYTHYFSDKQHRELRDHLLTEKSKWILSYDSAVRVEELYGRAPKQVDLLYSVAAKASQRQAQEIVLSNVNSLPEQTRLWRRQSEWLTTRSRLAIAVANGDGPSTSTPFPELGKAAGV
jgi:DNA adenine methylase